jgi:uncharacterized protein
MTRLDNLASEAGSGAIPPVEQWNPPFCGDIGLSIDRHGTWFYQGSPIGRQALVRLFARILRRDDDGHHYLVTPVEKVSIAVADAPFLAVEMQVSGSGRDQLLTFRTNVDDVVSCGPAHPIRFCLDEAGGGLKPYVLVRGRLEALVTRAVYYDLMERVAEHDDAHGIWSGGRFFPLTP